VWRAANLNPQPISFLPQNATTIVVVDQSKSIYAGAYKRIASAFRRLIAADVPMGLVAFSDTAYEMLPPEARSTDLKAMLRFYVPTKTGQNVDPETSFPASPWDNVFSAGTKISSGLNMALSMIERDHVKRTVILLASDLQTASEDQPSLAQTLARIQRDKQVTLKVLPLFPLKEDRQFFASFVPRRDFLKPSQIKGPVTTSGRTGVIGSTPWPLLVVAALLLLALAANELLCARVRVPATAEASP
jgi:VWA domain-containing protein